ncbi:MAG: TonB-dependent receptor [Acidobacteria bacterium]|nr:MAG: TonB-dependent receptor [Acidobacteriota bacterium]MCE7956826.1 TonB-dependent receptor [Acidobacteria bacterium ACB2]
MRSRIFVFMAVLAVVALGAGVAWADGTQQGSIGGVIRDGSGQPIPGAQISAKGIGATGISRQAFSSSNGSYAIRLLPPGKYAVEVALSGFQTVTAEVTVFTERNTAFDATLQLAVKAESVSVTAELPVVDKTNTTQGANVNANFTQKLALGRSYQTVIQMSPGVTGGANPNVRGALSGSNVFLFDGVDTTDTSTGTFGMNFNYEAIQEVAINTGGFSAEYGRASGAVVSVITKSGTNEFHGSAKLIFNNDDWNADNKKPNEVTGVVTNRNKYDEVQYRYSGTLGGPILKDRLWFFGAVEYAPTTTPETQTVVTNEAFQQEREITLWSGKLTWQITPNHTVEASGSGDPFTGILRNDYWGVNFTAEREALTAQEQGGSTWRGFYSGIIGQNLSLEATFATADSRIDVGQFETNPTSPFYMYNGQKFSMAEASAPHYDLSRDAYFNGATFDGYVERPRTQANLAVNYYQQLFGGSHNFKAGLDYQRLESTASYAYPGQAVYYDDFFDPATREFVPNQQELFDPPQDSTSKGDIYAFYLQDKMDYGRLFVNLGFRVDFQKGKSDLGRTTFDATTFSPRISAKYDITGKGKTLVSANYGHFYQSLIQSFSDGYAGVPQLTNKVINVYNPETGRFEFLERIEEGGNSTAINEGLKPTYTQDLTLGFEQQIGPVLGVALRGTYRRWNDLIDDVRTLRSDGSRTQDYVNYDGAHRRYRGLELVIDKRYASNWQAFLSYTLSRTEGNHFSNFASQLGDFLDSTATRSGSQPVPGYVINEQNLYGLAFYDRTHEVKLFGAYDFRLGIVTLTPASTVGWRSGYPYQRTVSGWRLAGQQYTQMTSQRGSDRYPDQFYWDFGLEARFRIFGTLEAGLKAEVFNVTDTQTKLSGTTTDGANYGKATSSTANYAAPRSFVFHALITF